MAKVDIDQLKPNSHTYKEGLERKEVVPVSKEKPKLAPVVDKASIVRTKKTFGQKFKEAFISDDTKDVKTYIWKDVVIPTIKNTILDVGEMVLFGGSTRRSYRDRDRDRVSYSSYYKSEYNRRRDRDRRDDDRYVEDEKVDYRNIVLINFAKAEKVVKGLRERIEEYDQATVADLFDLIEVSSNYMDNNWGWTDPMDIGIRRVSSGYLIDVAEAKHLD